MSSNSIDIINASIGYFQKKEPRTILEGINLTIPKGSFVALIGENGSGKSTLLRSLAKQQPWISGEVLFSEQKQQDFIPLEWAKKLAWVHTERSLPKGLSTAELIALGRQPYTNWLDTLTNADRSIVENVLEATDLKSLADKKCHELSDGQLQRAFIARAMAQDTDFILLDEPCTHLDVLHKVNILSLLKQLSTEQEKTIIFSTHEIELALQVCNHFICIHDKKVQLLSKQEIIESDILNAMFKHPSLYFDSREQRFLFK